VLVQFDFSVLKQIPMSLKLDVGASAYWSEIASMQTLDNLLMRGKIDVVDYLERVPNGYISKKQELIGKIKQAQMAAQQMMMQAPPDAPTSAPITDFNLPIPVEGGRGYGALQRDINAQT
jgi:hypothetical protein